MGNEKAVLDLRGMPCPQPVVKTRQKMKEMIDFSILVSQADQVDNVTRMAQRSGWNVKKTVQGNDFKLDLTTSESSGEAIVKPEDLTCSIASGSQGGLVVLQSDTMGNGDDSLGRLLMKAYVNTLKDLDKQPETIILFNSAVKLAINNSPVLDSLKNLEADGVELLVCGTCLDFFGIKDKLAAGHVSNMFDIANTMMNSGITVLS